MELLPKGGHIRVILEYLKPEDMHTKSGMRSDLNTNWRFIDFFTVYSLKEQRGCSVIVLEMSLSLKFIVFLILLNSLLNKNLQSLAALKLCISRITCMYKPATRIRSYYSSLTIILKVHLYSSHRSIVDFFPLLWIIYIRSVDSRSWGFIKLDLCETHAPDGVLWTIDSPASICLTLTVLRVLSEE